MAGIVAKLVRYTGRVQGVGFRYTTMRVAGRFEVTGYVKNLPDGRVEVLVQGTSEEIEAFLEALDTTMAVYIRDTHATDTAAHDYADFRIAF